MKGKFTYDNKTFRWKFQIREYDTTSHFNADAIIFYRNNLIQIIPGFAYCDIESNYNILFERYNNKSDEEINEIAKDKIIKKYELLKAKKRFE